MTNLKFLDLKYKFFTKYQKTKITVTSQNSSVNISERHLIRSQVHEATTFKNTFNNFFLVKLIYFLQ